MQVPTIEGWLEKQGGVRKNWKRRYFVLDGKKLKYFKQQRDAPSKPIDAIILDRTSKIIYIRDKVRPNDSALGCGFAIETPSRTYILAAGSMVERDRWAIDIQMALSVLYGLPKPVTLARPDSAAQQQQQAAPPGGGMERQPSGTLLQPPAPAPATSPGLQGSSMGAGGPQNRAQPRYSMAYSELPLAQPASGSSAKEAPVGDGLPTIEDYNGDHDARRGTQNLLSMAKTGLSALNPISGSTRAAPLGRKDEVDMLKEELLRKDRQLELAERKLRVLDGAYADMSEKYFVSVAVFAKMNAATEGCYCNIDVYQLYAEAQRLQIDPQEWPQWITTQVQQNASRMRA